MTQSTGRSCLGVIVVTFNSADVITECLDTLFAAEDVDLRVVVVDNDSTDATVDTVRDWAAGIRPTVRPAASPLASVAPARRPIALDERDLTDKSAPCAPLTLVRTGLNGGFAFGVNRGLELLLADEAIDVFWLLNPDCAVPPDAPAKLMATAAKGPFAMIGLRQVYYEHPHIVQTDAFRLNRKTGVCTSINTLQPVATAEVPDESEIDFVSGATMAVSRQFVESAGLLPEDYFLYYEEASWAMRKGSLPVRLVPDATIYHHSGTAIGSSAPTRRSSPMSVYFNHRNRIIFVRRHLPRQLFVAKMFGVLKAIQLLISFAPAEALALLAGALELRPPARVRARFGDPRVRELAFGKGK